MNKTQCLVCYKCYLPHLETGQPGKGDGREFSINEENAPIKHHLTVIFLLMKLLKIPQETCIQLLKESGNPSSWIYLCECCLILVEKAKRLWDQIVLLQKKFEKLQDDFKRSVVISEETFKNAVSQYQETTVGFKPTQLIRSSVLPDNCRRTVQQTISVKEEPLNSDVDENIGYFCSESISDGENDFSSSNTPIREIDTFTATNHKESDFGSTFLKEELNISSDINTGQGKINPIRTKVKIEKQKRVNGECTDKISKSHLQEFKCKYCEKAYSSRRGLKLHLRYHSEETPNCKFTEDKGKKKLYYCSFCPKSFTCRSNLGAHVRMHKGETFDCTVCEKKFAKPFQLLIHNRSHTGERPFSCTLCEKKFISNRSLTMHLRLHTEEKRFSCETCGKKYNKKAHLQRHELTHSGLKLFSCSVCRKGFSVIEGLKKHEIIHTGEMPYSCSTCGKKFAHLGNMKAHEKAHSDPEGKPHHCNTCGKRFTQGNDLLRHQLSHTGERPFCCDICTKTFRYKSNLTIHRRSHTGEKPFSCETCGKGFTASGHLLKHKLLHTGEKPYICETCGRGFSQLARMKIHMRSIHTHEKPFLCATCGKGFVSAEHLKEHATTHSNEKPFRCTQCGRLFSRAQLLKKHSKVHTKNP